MALLWGVAIMTRQEWRYIMMRQEWRYIFWLEELGLWLHVQRSMFE